MRIEGLNHVIAVCPSLNGMVAETSKRIVGPRIKTAGRFYDQLRQQIVMRVPTLKPCKSQTWNIEVPEVIQMIEGGVGFCHPQYTATKFVRRQHEGKVVWCLKRDHALPVQTVQILLISSEMYLRKRAPRLPKTISVNEGVVRQAAFVIAGINTIANTEPLALVDHAELAERYGTKNSKTMPPALLAYYFNKLVLVADG